jgi:hypothetical protein
MVSRRGGGGGDTRRHPAGSGGGFDGWVGAGVCRSTKRTTRMRGRPSRTWRPSCALCAPPPSSGCARARTHSHSHARTPHLLPRTRTRTPVIASTHARTLARTRARTRARTHTLSHTLSVCVARAHAHSVQHAYTGTVARGARAHTAGDRGGVRPGHGPACATRIPARSRPGPARPAHGCREALLHAGCESQLALARAPTFENEYLIHTHYNDGKQ